MDTNFKAIQAYRLISRASSDAAMMQAGANLVSLLTGGLPVIHLAVDGVCLTFQATLINEIGDLYGRPRITTDAALAYLRPNLPFIFGNLALDKGLGVAVPVLGLPFCYAFARALTWRLGAFFTATAALGGEIPRPLFLEKLAALVAELFPRGDFFFTLADPDKEKFIALISSLEGLSEAQAEARITMALRVLRGDDAVAQEPAHENTPAVTETAEEGGVLILGGEWNATLVSEPIVQPAGEPVTAQPDDALSILDVPLEANGEAQLILLAVNDNQAEEPAAPLVVTESVDLPLAPEENLPVSYMEPKPEAASTELPETEDSTASKKVVGRPKGAKSGKK